MTEHVSSMTIDALAAGLLPADEATAANTHVESCARCKGDLETARAACATFTREVFPRTVERLRPRPWWLRLAPLMVPMLAAASLLLWLAVRPHATTPVNTGAQPDDGPDIQLKGPTTFKVFAKHGERVFALKDRGHLAAGDAIRFVAGARTARYLIVASVDGAGSANVYFPYGGTRSVAIEEMPAELPGSIVLDDAAGPERIFAVFTNEPIETSVVTAALTALGRGGPEAIRKATKLDVAAAAQSTLVFEKDHR